MKDIPLDPYDFFGYLACGLVAMFGMEFLFGFPRVTGVEWKSVDSAFLLISTYVAGQIVATPAKTVLEDLLIGNILGRPSVNLFREKSPTIRGLIFPGYYQKLPEPTRKRIVAKATEEGGFASGEALFLHVRYSQSVLDNERLMKKLDTFVAKYGFSRNLSFSGLMLSAALGIQYWQTGNLEAKKYAITAAIVGLLLLYRYLKFFRQYSYELFNFYGGRK